MKKQIITMAAVAAMAFLAGASFNNWITGNSRLHEDNIFNRKVIKAQEAALDKAEEVMDNNNLWDADGSDTMAEYMEACNKVQTLYATQQ